MISHYHQLSHDCSALVTRRYSTSFSSAIQRLHKDLRGPVHDIYGFVRLADEIVDSFHQYDKAQLLDDFIRDTWKAIGQGISLNPVLHSFQRVVHGYHIPHKLIRAFLQSMQLDLHKTDYASVKELDEYVYGSAEVVGLMCLCVFCEGNEVQFRSLEQSARRLGAAFQKVNFLRDIQSDFNNLNRTYFPDLDFYNFTAADKRRIEADIAQDFEAARAGIGQLPWKARFAVYTAYRYYYTLFKKIRRLQPAKVLERRVRVPDYEKLLILFRARCYNSLNLI